MDVIKTALVTGGNKGLGLEMARQLTERGYKVWIGSRDRQRGETAAAQLAAVGKVGVIELDVTSPTSIAAAARGLSEETDHLDVLINNAGIVSPKDGKPSETAADAIKAIFETNVFGVLQVTQAFLPLVRKSPSGRIVVISSGMGSLSRLSDPADSINRFGTWGYSASKAALNVLTVSLANELRDTPITVNAINPGFVATDINDNKGVLTVAQGVRRAIELATMASPPTGGFFNDAGVEPW